MPRPPISLMLDRSLRNVCPRCGVGALYRKDVRMFRRCPECSLSYYPESGFYLGGMILNYVLTVAIVITAFLTSLLMPDFLPWSDNVKILLWMVFAVALSLIFWKYTRSLWLGFIYWLEPWETDAGMRR